MEVEDKNITPDPTEDCLAIFLFRTVEELARDNFQYSPKRDLARAELHGARLEEVIQPTLTSINSSVHNAQAGNQINSEILPELRKLDIDSAKARVLRQVDSMPSSKVRERVSTIISYIHWLKAKGYTIDPADEAFLHLNIEEQERLAREVIKLVAEVCFAQLWRLFLVALNKVRRYRGSFEDHSLVGEVCQLLAWRTTLELLPLADNPTATEKLLCPEIRAVVEDREAMHNWGGDHDKAFLLLDGALGVDLQRRLKFKKWRIPGSRYRGFDNWEKPLNDEPELLRIGELYGLKWARKQDLLELLGKGASGELHNAFVKIAVNTLLGEIRKANQRSGIRVPPDWSSEGKTEEEIRKQIDKDLHALAGRELLDYDVETEDGSVSILQQAGDKQAFEEWQETETKRKVLITEKVQQLISRVKLTPRLQLVADLFDKPNEEIALAYYKRFGKRVKPGAIRTAKFRLLQKLGKPKKS